MELRHEAIARNIEDLLANHSPIILGLALHEKFALPPRRSDEIWKRNIWRDEKYEPGPCDDVRA